MMFENPTYSKETDVVNFGTDWDPFGQQNSDGPLTFHNPTYSKGINTVNISSNA